MTLQLVGSARPLLNTVKSKTIQLSIRTSFMNKYRHGPLKISNPDPPSNWVHLKEFFTIEGQRLLWNDLDKVLRRMFKPEFLKILKNNVTYIFEDFDSDESIKNWKAVADQDSLNGFSTSNITRSPAGHALFSGVLDTRKPDDGMTANSGFVAIIGPVAEREYLFQVETYHDWTKFDCFEIRFRGDGRKYSVVINTSSDMAGDLAYYDNHSYPLYTRGGPYWQTVRIPFSKFIFNYKGFVQDKQGAFPARSVRFVSIALSDGVDGPYSLEIDYMGLRRTSRPFREISAYEEYTYKHIRYKPLQVDAPVPENT